MAMTLSIEAQVLNRLSVDDINDLAVQVRSVQFAKNEKMSRRRSRLIRSLLVPGAVVIGDALMVAGRYRRTHIKVRELRGTTLRYRLLKRDGTEAKDYVYDRSRGRRVKRLVRDRMYYFLEPRFYERITSIRHKGKVVYRRSDFLKANEAKTLRPVGHC